MNLEPVIIVILIVAIVYITFIADLSKDLAESKGYEGDRGYMCGLFLGPIALIYYAGLPDISSNRKITKQCPYCGGRIEGEFELCRNCKSRLSYVDGIPCKAQYEDEFRKERILNQKDVIKEEDLKERLAEDEYLNQKVEFSRRNDEYYMTWRCICKKLLKTNVKNIGMIKICPSCKRKLGVIGDEQYRKFSLELGKGKSGTR